MRYGEQELVNGYLNGLFEVDVERVAGSVGKEFGVVFGQDAAQSFELDADAVIGGAIGRPVQAETDDEDALVDAELDAVAAAAVAPLVAAVGRRLEPVADLLFQSGAQFRTVDKVFIHLHIF